MKSLILLLTGLFFAFGCYAQPPAAITGPSIVCAGTSTVYSDATPGGSWSSADALVATIDPVTGAMTGVAAGVVTISYTLPSTTYAVLDVSVMPTPCPTPMTPTSICVGMTDVITGCISGGMWTSASTGVASIDPATGAITGNAAGVTAITYTLGSGCFTVTMFSVNPLPAPITGASEVCVGSSIALSTASPGGVWISSNIIIATTDPTGLIYGGAAGTATITYALAGGAGCYTTKMITVDPAPTSYSLSGGGAYCPGGAGLDVILSGSDAGFSYQLFVGGTPAGLPIPGTGSPLTFGPFTAAGTYTIAGTNLTTSCTGMMTGSAVITAGALPVMYTVTGGGSYCAGGTGVDVMLNSSDAGVDYQLYDGASAVGSAIAGTGTVIDFGLQTTAGVYTVIATNASTGCTSTMAGSDTVTITPVVSPAIVITPTPSGAVCPGVSVAYHTSVTNGGPTPVYDWYVNGAPMATGSTFTYAPANGDVVLVNLTSSAACASPATAVNSVTASVAYPAITASASAVGCNGAYTLTGGGGSSYSWAPTTGLSCPTCAVTTINPTATTTYTVTGTNAAGCSNTATATVNGNRIMGTVSPAVGGTIKVWLIQFHASDSSIASLDSTTTCTASGSQYYEFDGPAGGDYLVKAYLTGGTAGTSGYIPTYGSSSAIWSGGTTVTHAAGTDNQNITMLYGTVPTGPGFIGGFISSGAGRGTSGTIPAKGLLVYLMDASTHDILTYTYTDGAGNYAFNSLAYGSYIIYPEEYQFTTTPSWTIKLNSTNESVNGINFKERTAFRTIAPSYTTMVNAVTAKGSISVYPNPTSGDAFIQWGNQATGTAAISVTDVLGRVVFNSAINMTAASGQQQIGLQGLKAGVYLITIKNNDINYSGKIVVEN